MAWYSPSCKGDYFPTREAQCNGPLNYMNLYDHPGPSGVPLGGIGTGYFSRSGFLIIWSTTMLSHPESCVQCQQRTIFLSIGMSAARV